MWFSSEQFFQKPCLVHRHLVRHHAHLAARHLLEFLHRVFGVADGVDEAFLLGVGRGVDASVREGAHRLHVHLPPFRDDLHEARELTVDESLLNRELPRVDGLEGVERIFVDARGHHHVRHAEAAGEVGHVVAVVGDDADRPHFARGYHHDEIRRRRHVVAAAAALREGVHEHEPSGQRLAEKLHVMPEEVAVGQVAARGVDDEVESLYVLFARCKADAVARGVEGIHAPRVARAKGAAEQVAHGGRRRRSDLAGNLHAHDLRGLRVVHAGHECLYKGAAVAPRVRPLDPPGRAAEQERHARAERHREDDSRQRTPADQGKDPLHRRLTAPRS